MVPEVPGGGRPVPSGTLRRHNPVRRRQVRYAGKRERDGPDDRRGG